MGSPEPFLLPTQRAAFSFPLWREYPPQASPKVSEMAQCKTETPSSSRLLAVKHWQASSDVTLSRTGPAEVNGSMRNGYATEIGPPADGRVESSQLTHDPRIRQYSNSAFRQQLTVAPTLAPLSEQHARSVPPFTATPVLQQQSGHSVSDSGYASSPADSLEATRAAPMVFVVDRSQDHGPTSQVRKSTNTPRRRAPTLSCHQCGKLLKNPSDAQWVHVRTHAITVEQQY